MSCNIILQPIGEKEWLEDALRNCNGLDIQNVAVISRDFPQGMSMPLAINSAPEIIEGLPIEKYHAHPAISKSGLKTLITRSPAHYFAEYRQAKPLNATKKKSSPEKDFGSAFHTLILEPKFFKRFYAPRPDGLHPNSKAYKALAQAAADQGKNFLTTDELESLVLMREALLRHPVAGKYLPKPAKRKALIETSFFFTCPETGLRCKCRPDAFFPQEMIAVDPKTTKDASPYAFAKDFKAYGYDIQDAFYERMALFIYETPLVDSLYIASEKEDPYAIGVYRLSEEDKQYGHERMLKGLHELAKCERDNNWPDYSQEIETLYLTNNKEKGEKPWTVKKPSNYLAAPKPSALK